VHPKPLTPPEYQALSDLTPQDAAARLLDRFEGRAREAEQIAQATLDEIQGGEPGKRPKGDGETDEAIRFLTQVIAAIYDATTFVRVGDQRVRMRRAA
jgi:hypothetical protein